MTATFIEVKDDLLSKDECKTITQWFLDNKQLKKEEERVGYWYADHLHYEEIPSELQPMVRAICSLKDSYVSHYPESDMLPDSWVLPSVRFKWWKPGDYYKSWHSEHNSTRPNMILGFMIYLSDNDCSTEFMRYDNVETKAGRGLMFPTFFTHTHRGSVCKKGLDRFALSGYYHYESR